MNLGLILTLVQFIFAVIIGLYFWNLLKNQQAGKAAINRDSKKEMDKLYKMRQVSLTTPLTEITRPSSLKEIVGQEEGIKALKAALCGPNPQHVIIYGPPGVGKTAAARLVLEEAKKNPHSPFHVDAQFVEVDATTVRFDERGIADPLIGSVHDPIYQGAGALGSIGVPQPKPGAVTRAHGGVLFIDEIGELHTIQMNKLLKVLEDRKVYLESAYYNPDDPNIPKHIKDIFDNGLPADFRLVGATTRLPHEIAPAIRSRCLEIFFRPLRPEEVSVIARNAFKKAGFEYEASGIEVLTRYATNGREAVNIVQIAAGLAQTEGRDIVRTVDIEWVINSGQYSPRNDKKIPSRPQVGVVNGLAVAGPNMGVLLEIEATARRVRDGQGALTVTGLVEEEEIGGVGGVRRRKSLAVGSVENVMTVLRQVLKEDPRNYAIHVNFPGGMPIDGPSAGVGIATAIYSGIKGLPVDNRAAMTGEISIRGKVKPVGGVMAKIDAARSSGVKRVIIPKENWQEMFSDYEDIKIIPVETFDEVLQLAFEKDEVETDVKVTHAVAAEVIPGAAIGASAQWSVTETIDN